MKPSQSSTLIPLAPKASAQQLCCGLHKQDMDRQCQKQVSRVWLYFAVQKSFGAILRQTSLIEALSNQYCIAAWSIEEAIAGIKGASIFYLLYHKVPFPFLSNCSRLKYHILAFSKQLLSLKFG